MYSDKPQEINLKCRPRSGASASVSCISTAIPNERQKIIKENAKKCPWVVTICFCDNCLEVHFDDSGRDDRITKDYVCKMLKLQDIRDKVKVLRVLESEFKEFSSVTIGDQMRASINEHVSAGAFLEVHGKPHILTASHGILKAGTQVTSIGVPPSFTGTVQVHFYRLERDACDVALVEINDSNVRGLSNTTKDSNNTTYDLELFSGSAAEISNIECFKFEPNFDKCPGIVHDMDFYYKYAGKLYEVNNCIAIVSKEGKDHHFIQEGDSGKVVFMKRTEGNQAKAVCFGIIFGEVTLCLRREDEVEYWEHYALLSDLPRALGILQQHRYCKGGNLALIPPPEVNGQE